MKLVPFTVSDLAHFHTIRPIMRPPLLGQIRHGLVKFLRKKLAYKGGRCCVSLSPQPLKTRHLRAVSTVLAMNAFPNGTRVFYWASGGEIKYGTVQATNRMADGTQIVVVKVDGEGHAQLPVSSLVKVNQ
ncbi:hypothetical protein BDR07DRAFT_1411320 [Suillus spraguei]|nr:hypothetical protein BDR07DRAFT_1411320 [Suillus spraguei]